MDKALKQRLVGASVLIALAVIVLPMLLGGRPEGGTVEPKKIAIPEQPPELSFETRRYPIGETPEKNQPESQGDEAVVQLPAPRPSAAEVVIVDEVAQDALDLVPDEVLEVKPDIVSQPPPEDFEPEEIESDTPPATDVSTGDQLIEMVAGRYIVQVASFGASDNAKKLSADLEKNGYTVMTDSVKSDVGTLHRVRVGPFDNELDASAAAAALESSINGVRPRVVDLKPENAAQVTTPADPLVRWVVQVGSFSSAGNADKLVASLRLIGLSTYQETITTSGTDLYRVRVGPFLQREEAIRVERQIRQDMALKGVVMSAD